MYEKTFSAINLIESLKGHNLTGEAKALLDKLVKESEGCRAQLEMRPRLLIDVGISERFSKEEVEMLEGETYSDTVLRHLKTINFISKGAVKGVMAEIQSYKGLLNSAIEALGEDDIFTGEIYIFISKVNTPTATLIQIDLTR